MSVLQADLQRTVDHDVALLRGGILNHHSSWAALCLCLKVKPDGFRALLKAAGVTHGRQHAAFDACADAYSVYLDGQMRGKVAR